MDDSNQTPSMMSYIRYLNENDMHRLNEAVPERTILRYVQKEKAQLERENDRLRLEIKRLQGEIDRRDRAIAAFKKWQGKVAEYKYDYWLHEGLKLMEEQPEQEECKALFRLVNSHAVFEQRFQALKRSLDYFVKAKNAFAQEGKEP